MDKGKGDNNIYSIGRISYGAMGGYQCGYRDTVKANRLEIGMGALG